MDTFSTKSLQCQQVVPVRGQAVVLFPPYLFLTPWKTGLGSFSVSNGKQQATTSILIFYICYKFTGYVLLCARLRHFANTISNELKRFDPHVNV